MTENIAIEMFLAEYDPFDNYVQWMWDDKGWFVLGGDVECQSMRPTDHTRTSFSPIACVCNEFGDICHLHLGEN
jgi:hypothetical protein